MRQGRPPCTNNTETHTMRKSRMLSAIGGLLLLGGGLVSLAQAEITVLAGVRPFFFGNSEGLADREGSQVCAQVHFTPFGLTEPFGVVGTTICVPRKSVNARSLCQVLSSRILARANAFYPGLSPRPQDIAIQGCGDAFADAEQTR